jgi:hypothetical protein
MIRFTGGLSLVVEMDGNVSYSRVEDALNSQAIMDGYLINRAERSGSTQFTISVHVPTRTITGDGVPPMEAISTLRAVANALAEIDQAPR